MSLIKKSILAASLMGACVLVNAAENKQEHFPDIKESYLSEVKQYDLADAQHISNGLSKDQIRHVLGNPQFSEGVFNVKNWNYVMAIRQPNSTIYNICQLKLNFEQV